MYSSTKQWNWAKQSVCTRKTKCNTWRKIVLCTDNWRGSLLPAVQTWQPQPLVVQLVQTKCVLYMCTHWLLGSLLPAVQTWQPHPHIALQLVLAKCVLNKYFSLSQTTWKNVDNMKTNKLDLPKVYSSLELAMSIISCFYKQTNWPSDPNKVRIWHRLPQQMPIRCYLIEGQSQTNKSNRK